MLVNEYCSQYTQSMLIFQAIGVIIIDTRRANFMMSNLKRNIANLFKENEWFPPPRFLLRKNAIKRILLKQDNLNDKICIEIGYGSGYMLTFFSKYFSEIHGFDYSARSYQMAKAKIDRRNDYENIKLLDSENDIEYNKYDFLVALEVIEHIEDDLSKLKEWYSMLSKNGKMILSVPAHNKKWSDHDVASGHYRRYERKEIITLCEKANLHVRYLWNYGFPLTLLLDKMLHSSGKKRVNIELKNENLDKEELTKQSGIRSKKKLLKFFSNDVTLYTFYLAQTWFFDKDISSCYVLLLEK